MKVLITGGSGFTGSRLAKKIYDTGCTVRLLVRDHEIPFFPEMPNLELVKGDIRDKNAVETSVQGVDRIFHLAAAYRKAETDISRYFDVHVAGTQNLLAAALKYGVSRFIHCSTVGVHGHIAQPPADETYPLNPGDIYQRTKMLGELEALEFHKKTGLPVSVIRPCAIYGPGDMRLLKLFRLSSRKIIPILGHGNIFYHMVYIDDLTDAFLLAADHPDAVGQSFIIGGNECLTLNQIIDLISSNNQIRPIKIHLPALPFQLLGNIFERILIPVGISPPIYRRRVDFFTKSRSFNIHKSKQLLGFQPKFPIEKGLMLTRKWYLDQKLL